MKPRIRAPSDAPRKHSIPIRFNDKEQELLANAAHLKGMLVSTFIATVALREAAKVTKNKQ